MWSLGWRARYLRLVRSSFATVPFYRELWAVDGRTDPTLVPGRTGRHGGAVGAEVVAGRLGELVPLSGGAGSVDPLRGLDSVRGWCATPVADELLGALGGPMACGHWHVDWPRVYARATPAGVAFSLLRQRSPRLVDILPATRMPGTVGRCARHGTPVVLP